MNHNVTIVCCIEAGPLEAMTTRMIESLRRWGGRISQAPVLAVTPRSGPRLSPKTSKHFQALGVRYLRVKAGGGFSWNNFMNKPNALILAEKETDTDCIAWLDSDILVLHEPEQLDLVEDEDFAACVPDKNVGTYGPGDRNEAYWRRIGTALDVNIEKLPWIITETEQEKIRLYFNSGVFVYRKNTNFGQEFLSDCRKILAARVASRDAGIFFTDQVALGLTAFRLGLRYKVLPHKYNYAVGSKSLKAFVPEIVREVSILHHHDAMWPALWPTLLACLETTHPEVSAWLAQLGVLTNPLNLAGRLQLKVRKSYRAWRLQQFMQSCEAF
jgi:hypothetical protein